MEEKICWRAKC